MAIKNFQNKLKEKAPTINILKDPSLAEDFSLVDFDDNSTARITGFKPSSNPVQTQFKPSLDPVQTQFKPSLNEVQTGSSTEKKEEISGVKPSLDPVQTQFKPSLTNSLMRLVGIQRELLFFLFKKMLRSSDGTTGLIFLNDAQKICKCSYEGIRTAIKKLKKLKLIYKIESKEGRGGWSQYKLSESAYSFCLDYLSNLNHDPNHSKQELNPVETRCKPGAISGVLPSSSSSSSLLLTENNKTTTTETEPSEKTELNGKDVGDWSEWEKIDFSELNELDIHFGRPQLKQWFQRKYCNAKEAQESIFHFAFDYKNNKREYRVGPLGFFMGIMSKSHYFPRPDRYKSPEEISLEQRADDLKKKNENIQRLQEEIFQEAFKNWFNQLKEEEIRALSPYFSGMDKNKMVIESKFREQYWVTIKDNPSIDVTGLKLKEQLNLENPLPPGETQELSEEEIRWITEEQFGPMPEEEN